MVWLRQGRIHLESVEKSGYICDAGEEDQDCPFSVRVVDVAQQLDDEVEVDHGLVEEL